MATPENVTPLPALELGQTYEFTTRQLWDTVDTGYKAWKAWTGSEGWALYVTPTVPPGMAVTASSLSGTPTAGGSFSVGLRYTDRYGVETDYTVAVTVAEAVPEPGETTDAKADVAQLMGQPDNPDLVAVIDKAMDAIYAMVSAYTRGNGFTGGVPNKELRAVIQTATARLTANPDQVASTVGGVTIASGFNGWSLAELAVLNRYRKRAL